MCVLYLEHKNKIYNNWCCVNKRNLNYINNQNIIIWWQRAFHLSWPLDYPFVLYVYMCVDEILFSQPHPKLDWSCPNRANAIANFKTCSNPHSTATQLHYSLDEYRGSAPIKHLGTYRRTAAWTEKRLGLAWTYPAFRQLSYPPAAPTAQIASSQRGLLFYFVLICVFI